MSTVCSPVTVATHARRMRNIFVWGTHVEIYAMSLYLGVSAFVAIQYYWAKYKLPEKEKEKLLFPAETKCSISLLCQ